MKTRLNLNWYLLPLVILTQVISFYFYWDDILMATIPCIIVGIIYYWFCGWNLNEYWKEEQKERIKRREKYIRKKTNGISQTK